MGILQNAILNSANFATIATDENGVIQLFNVGAERMLGHAAADVINRITPADISAPQEVVARAKLLSFESAPTTPRANKSRPNSKNSTSVCVSRMSNWSVPSWWRKKPIW